MPARTYASYDRQNPYWINNVKETLSATSPKQKIGSYVETLKSYSVRKTKDVAFHYKLRALLGRFEELSEQRNKYLHNAWAINQDGSVVTKGDAHVWGKAPTADDLNKLASEISECVGLRNDARLKGFIHGRLCNGGR